MVEGMKFNIKGSELSELLAKRAAWHKERAEVLKTKNLKEAQDGMKAAANAAAAAGSSFGEDDVEVLCEVASLDLMPYAAGSGAPRRNYGGNVEDPVAAIKKAIAFHTERGSAMAFYSKHVVVEATYVLTESDVGRYELIIAAGL